ncbi:metallophosphoesterase family protein [Sphingobium algorifonticola]|uniref:Serine/threonine protein phosphatase n=1 Tax=Sphingobium algorifonticola TaxID=2008318 RepID=A0A437J4B7_9SPHN|nr:metallophosphoesterase family protein [Sphingobium algorifonticola]RVT39465.1 serine/threonine protein phosphatase [Sphingobium algorifonticola]
MLHFFRKVRGGYRGGPDQFDAETRPASVGEAQRIYAIGDIHGRADLFADLLNRIARDSADREPLPTQLILLGDLVDRGPASRDVVNYAMHLAQNSKRIRFLKGNHEELFVGAARGDVGVARFFCRIGGRETLLSYGLDPAAFDTMDGEQLAAWMLANVPRDHVDFIDAFENMIEIGDYLFVHAGVRPGIPLDKQDPGDLRWIRNEFLVSRANFGKVIVHGHTITEAVDVHPNRIGIDTGAYMSERLTAIGLQGTDRWFLSTAD